MKQRNLKKKRQVNKMQALEIIYFDAYNHEYIAYYCVCTKSMHGQFDMRGRVILKKTVPTYEEIKIGISRLKESIKDSRVKISDILVPEKLNGLSCREISFDYEAGE